MHTSTVCLLGQVVEGNSCWDHGVSVVTSQLVSCNNQDQGRSTATGLQESPVHDIDCLTNPTTVVCSPF